MTVLTLIDIIAAIAGLGLTFLVCAFPRLGPASWTLGLFLMSGVFLSASVGLAYFAPVWRQPDFAMWSLVGLIICSANGCLASFTIGRGDYRGQLKKHRWLVGSIVAAAPILCGLVLSTDSVQHSAYGEAVLGFRSYVDYFALYLLLTSVIGLGSMEQTLRSAEQHVRWEIKFLLLGIASSFAAIVYVASKILLYPAQHATLSIGPLHIFPFIFLFSCGLILKSWRRSTGRSRIVVSQGVIYSTITLVSVGAYLLIAGLAALWAGQWGYTGIPAVPFFFIVSLVILLTILTGTAFRHRANRWIRQNVFAGRYDYRRFWMEASEHGRSVDSTTAPADGFAKLIERALGSLDISVWLRVQASETMRLAAVRGNIADGLPAEIPGLVSKLDGIREPVAVSDGEQFAIPDWPDDVLRKSRASLIVPLVSAKRLVGVLTVGSDRSGKPFDWETLEFLRVLALHFASEVHKSELLSRVVESREAEAFQTFSTFLLHDLKNFASTLSLIAKNAGRHQANPAFQQDAFQSIFEISDKMRRLCNSLRTFSTTTAGNKDWHDVNDILRSVAETFEGGGGVSLQLEPGAVPPVLVDREEIQRMIQNLVLNAHEASPARESIRLSSALEDTNIVIVVADSGKGISEEFLRTSLFHPFHTTKAEGLGIGLFHSKKIVEAHGGRIDVDSKEGRGTTIRVYLPIPSGLHPQGLSSSAVEDFSVTSGVQFC